MAYIVIGKFFPVLLKKYQQFIKEKGLPDNKQIIDFSSTIFTIIDMKNSYINGIEGFWKVLLMLKQRK